MMLAPGASIDGRYTVQGVLGQGGTSTVYKVQHNRLGSVHALKVLTLTHPDMARRLMDEGREQAALRHPNIVSVTDVIEVGGMPGLVMEFIDGGSLATVIDRVRLNDAQIDELALQLFAGVEAAHARGLTHRDLKPENLLLDLSSGRPQLKVADFGLVKIVRSDDRSKTSLGTVMGTMFYMAPEQSRDASTVDHRADVFSVGAILYELVTGTGAFWHNELVETLTRIRDGTYVPVDSLRPHAPERWIRAIQAALAPDLSFRCASIGNLRAIWTAGAEIEPARWDLSLLVAPSTEQTIASPTLLPEGPTAPPTEVRAPPAPPIAPVAARPEPGPVRPLVLLLAAGSALLVAVLLAWGAWGLLRAPTDDHLATLRPSEPPSAAGPDGADAPQDAVGLAPPQPAPEVPPAPDIRVEPARPAPRPDKAPVPDPAAPVVTVVPPLPPPPLPAPGPTNPRLRLEGLEGATFALKKPGSTTLVKPEAVTPGRWTVVVFFEPLVPVEIETLDLAADSVTTVRCSSVSRRCRVQPEAQ